MKSSNGPTRMMLVNCGKYTFADVDAEPAKHLVDGRAMPHEFLGGGPADVKGKDPRKDD